VSRPGRIADVSKVAHGPPKRYDQPAMKHILSDNKSHMLCLEPGEELLSSLKNWAVEKGVKAASFTALGASGKLTLAYFNLETNSYQDKVFDEDFEILGITGNISVKEGEVAVHAHGTFSGADYKVVGGHIKEARISVTCEIALIVYEGVIERVLDEKTGLSLMNG